MANRKVPDWLQLLEMLSPGPQPVRMIQDILGWKWGRTHAACSRARNHGYRIIYEQFAKGDGRVVAYWRLARPSYERAKVEAMEFVTIYGDPEYLSRKEAAAYSGVAIDTIDQWVHRRKIESRRVGAHRWIDMGTLPLPEEVHRPRERNQIGQYAASP